MVIAKFNNKINSCEGFIAIQLAHILCSSVGVDNKKLFNNHRVM